MFLKFSHPLSLLIIILIQTFILILIIGIISNSFWFSYILFLVFIGGLLILFTYIVSLIYNEKFNIKIKNNNFIIIIIITLTILIIIYFYPNFNILNNNELLNYNSTINFTETPFIYLIKIFNLPNNLITLFIIRYLFFILIIIIKLTNFHYGPFRVK